MEFLLVTLNISLVSEGQTLLIFRGMGEKNHYFGVNRLGVFFVKEGDVRRDLY
jgi:hypothetical protein